MHMYNKTKNDLVFPEYHFPVIQHINDLRPFYQDREEFHEQIHDDHITINYMVNFEDTFPHIGRIHLPHVETSALRRECRGIAFDKENGLIIRRAPHKFFNLNERDETLRKCIQDGYSTPFIFLEKLDGSCISAYKDCSGRIIWGTRAGETIYTPYVEAFVAANPQYHEVANYLIDLGWTPTFEFCSRKNRVVLDHPVDRLILTCVRQLQSGEYLPYDQMTPLRELGIEVVRQIDFKSIEECVEYAETATNEEGWIIRFESGHMIKVKTQWYVDIHGCVTGIKFEKDVLNILLNDRFDDLKPFLPEDMIKSMQTYEQVLHNGFWDTTMRIISVVDDFKDRTKKELATSEHRSDPMFAFIMNAFQRKDDLDYGSMVAFVYNDIRKYCADRTFSQTWVDRLRHFYGSSRFDI